MQPSSDVVRQGNLGPAVFSPCDKYRYVLTRRWWPLGKGSAMFIGLNPSTATEDQDDPTIRRCINYAKAWGYDSYVMTNLFAYRSTDPQGMKAQSDPIGQSNDLHILEQAQKAAIVIAAWGTYGEFMGRASQVVRMLPELHALRLTKDGHPAHPLYLPASLKPMRIK